MTENKQELPESSGIAKSNKKRNVIIGIVVGCLVFFCCLPAIAGTISGMLQVKSSESASEISETADIAEPSGEIIKLPPTPEETEAPTNTPEPTNTIAPTNTPEPTTTPEPTETSIPEPTNTLAPTDTPVEQQPSSGIGLSRTDFTTLFSQPGLGFTFEESSEVDGQPRIIGTGEFETVFMELIGPPDDLTQVSVMVGVSDDENEFANNLVYMVAFLSIAMPDWPEGADWLIENIDVAVSEGEAITTVNNKIVTFEYFSELGLLLLTIEAE